jgi:hypothetical protein
MSDEKRQTRLLPFRLRRGAASRVAEYDGAEDFSADAELTALLRAWEVPPPGGDARARLLADFRAGAPSAPLWRRVLAAELRVPLPVAACAALALLAALFALGARGLTSAAPAEAKAAAELKVVEVPVIRERVVTQTVYVGKKERGAPRVAPSQTPARDASRESLAQGAARKEPAGQPSGRDSNAGYFTRVNMEDFQPAEELKMRIVKRGSTDER